MREYFQLTRAHTTPLEAVPAVAGGLLATGGTLTYGVAFWGVVGVLYHLAGYGHNSLRDWEKGHDRDDPHKQHHPLNTGLLNPLRARRFIMALLALTVITALGGVLYYQSPAAATLLIVAAVAGVGYNEFSKETPYKFLLIATAHSMIFAVPYVALGGSITFTFLVLFSLVYLWVVYQIAISGEVKDLGHDDTNIIRMFDGIGYDDNSRRVREDGTVFQAGVFIRLSMGMLAILSVIANREGIAVVLLTIIILSTLASAMEHAQMFRSIQYRDKCLKKMAIIEVHSMIVFLAGVAAAIGGTWPIILLAVSAVWIVSFNIYQWDTFITPDV